MNISKSTIVHGVFEFWLKLVLSSFEVRPRPLDPSKDLASYGYGNIAWNNRMESWSQEKLTLVKGENSGNDYCDDDTLDRPL